MIRVRGKACQRGRCVRRSGQNRERRPCRSAAESPHENAFGQIRRRIDQRFADSLEAVEEVGIAARRAGVGAPYRGDADSPKVGNIVAAAALVRSWAGRRTLQNKAPSPGPSPSGGGCRPQGRPERENVTGPQCGNERSRGDVRTIVPSAGGHVLPLPSSASRGIGGCHLPPLGEGRGNAQRPLQGAEAFFSYCLQNAAG